MQEKLTADRAALVSTDLKYKRIDPAAPPQGKCIFINRQQGVAVISEYRKDFGWTHYFPLPTFDD